MIFRKGLTFDDVLLEPRYSEVHPSEVRLTTQLSENLFLNLPIMSAAMDTVTEASLAIEIARNGGLGVIHRLFSIKDQAKEVDKVKKSQYGMILNPVTLGPDATISDAETLMETYSISGIPITENRKLIGILTNRDIQFETHLQKKVTEDMTSASKLITSYKGTTIDEAQKILYDNRIEKLPIVDENFNLIGLITIKDIEKKREYPHACKDGFGRLCVGAAVGVDSLDRVKALVDVHVDVIVVDTAHGHSLNVIRTVEKIKEEFPLLPIIAGNVATPAGAMALESAGADAIKVGVGPGSICTTRIVAGIGVPQLTAILNIAPRVNIPIIADGGIRYSGDIVKALAAGADAVMIGGMFAGTDEAPGETSFLHGRQYKLYRGMGSLPVLRRGCKDRYNQEAIDEKKLVPEGVEGKVPYKGSLQGILFQLEGGMKQGFGYVGAVDIESLQNRARFIEITPAGYKESHVHDVVITKESPNYRLD